MLKTILVHACSEQRLGAQIDAVRDIARQNGSRLIGLAVLPAAIMLPAGVPGASDVIAIDAERRAFRAVAERLRTQFMAAAAAIGAGAEWILGDAQRLGEIEQLLSHAHAADLIVASPARLRWMGGETLCTAELLVLGSGRPVVVVPRAGSGSGPIARRVVVAWNGSREAARALADATPLLTKAEHVKVVSVSGDAPRACGSGSGLAGVAQSLARHGIRCAVEEIALADADAGPALLSAAKAENADLLVMGYRARWRVCELLVSGASRHVLAHTHVPVLMAH